MKQRKVLVGIAIAIFIILLLYWLLVAEDMKPWLSAMVPSACNNSLPDPDRFQIIGVYLQG